MRLSAPTAERSEDEGLRTERQIALYRMREAAKRARVERKEAEARVRHLNLELVERTTYLITVVVLVILWIAGAASDDGLLKAALLIGGAKAGIATRRRYPTGGSQPADRSGRPLL